MLALQLCHLDSYVPLLRFWNIGRACDAIYSSPVLALGNCESLQSEGTLVKRQIPECPVPGHHSGV